MGKQCKQWETFWAPKSLQMVTAAMKLRHLLLWRKAMPAKQHIKKQRHYFANKGPSSQSYGFSCSHVWMWELDYKECWAQKNWCFLTAVLQKTLESPLDCKEIQPVHPKGDQPWVFIGRADVEAETPIFCPPDLKSWLIWKDLDVGKDWRQEEKGRTEDKIVGCTRTWCTGKSQRDQVEREVGGGIGMGNTCKSMANSCQCMTKSTTIL